MDPYQITIYTYNQVARQFQDKFMEMDLYNQSYDRFCNEITKPQASIFEMACGPGNITRYLLKKRPDFKIWGIDLSEKMVELAQQNVPKAQFNQMDCRDIDQIDQTFDGIMCGFCLPYLSKEESAQLINDAYKLLNTNGVIYISTMEGEASRSGFETTSFSGELPIYIHYHRADDLTQALTQAGFKNIELLRQDYPEPDGSITTDLIFIAQK